MIINTNLQTPEKETIDYIRSIVGHFTEEYEDRELEDSLVFSFTQSEKSKVKKKKNKPKYVSPYSQKGLSIKNISRSKKKSPQRLNAFSKVNIQQLKAKEGSPKSRKKPSISRRYMQTPSLIQKLAQNQINKLKREACLLYKIQYKQKQKQELTDNQRRARWADFLLRQRKWEEVRQNKLMEAKYQAISEQKKFHSHNFVHKQLPPPKLEQHIRKIKRQKLKLQERLRQLQTNYFTWRIHKSPQRKKSISKRIQTQRPKVSNQKRIYLSNQKEISFLLNA